MICDTSGLLAAFAPDQPSHEECLRAMSNAEQLVVPSPVLTELSLIIEQRVGQHAVIAAVRELTNGTYVIAQLSPDDVSLSTELMTSYQDLGLGLTDAAVIVAAKRHSTDEILTLDQRHFRAVRSFSGRPFILLPGDSD
jgi:uncharacterized protein